MQGPGGPLVAQAVQLQEVRSWNLSREGQPLESALLESTDVSLTRQRERAGPSKRGRSGEVGTRVPRAWDGRQGPVAQSCTQRAGAKGV